LEVSSLHGRVDGLERAGLPRIVLDVSHAEWIMCVIALTGGCVSACECEDERGVAAADNLEHENDVAADVSFGELADHFRVVGSGKPPNQSRPLARFGQGDCYELS
jgi:hypothetical protein